MFKRFMRAALVVTVTATLVWCGTQLNNTINRVADARANVVNVK